MVPKNSVTRMATMATIIRLSRDNTENSNPSGVMRAFRLCICSPLYLLLAALLPVGFVVGVFMYMPFIAIQRLTGEYPLNLTFRLGENAPHNSTASSA